MSASAVFLREVGEFDESLFDLSREEIDSSLEDHDLPDDITAVEKNRMKMRLPLLEMVSSVITFGVRTKIWDLGLGTLAVRIQCLLCMKHAYCCN